MVEVTNVRDLIETIKGMAMYLTDEEISDIGIVLLRATKRIEKEQEAKNE